MAKKSFLLKIAVFLCFSLNLQNTRAQTSASLKSPDPFTDFIEIKPENLVKIESLKDTINPKTKDRNNLFREYNEIVESNFTEIAAGREPERLFFSYTNTEGFSVLELCARCNINYDTITTLNSIASREDDIKGKSLILPTVQGLFVALEPGINDIEILLQQNYKNQNLTKGTLCYRIKERDFIFIQGKRFSPTERAFYLDSSLILPLEKDSFVVSSEFGKRENPFSKKIQNHNGIDLAAAEGTPVYAVKDGDVAYVIQNDETFGNYIILSHDHGKQTSVYAHLSSVNVEQYQFVKKGTVIGYTGHTGLATGDHLHFEIRQSGRAQNPRDKLRF